MMKINHIQRMKSFCSHIINAKFKVSNHVYQPHQHDESITNSLLISIFPVTQLFCFDKAYMATYFAWSAFRNLSINNIIDKSNVV